MTDKEKVIQRLTRVRGIGLTKAEQLYKLKVRNKTDLHSPNVYKLLSRETKIHLRYNTVPCLSLNDVRKLTELLPSSLTLVGSGRRETEWSRDIDYLTTKPINDVVDEIKKSKLLLLAQLNCGDKRRSLIIQTPTKHNIKIDIFYTQPLHMPFALLHLTGSRTFNIRTRAQAKRLGYKLSQYGLFDKNGKRVPNLTTERKILQKIGVTYKKPSERNV